MFYSRLLLILFGIFST